MPSDPLLGETPPLSSWDFDPVEHAYRSYTAFLTSLFKNVAGTPLAEWAYDDDPLATKISIGGETPMDASVVAAKPAIVIDTQSVDPVHQIIGDFDKLDPTTGKVTYLKRTDSSLAVYVISKNKTEAKRIAGFINDMSWALHRTLISNGGFYLIGRNIRQGPALPPGSLVNAGDARSPLYAVPLSVPYTFIRIISVEPINVPKLNRMQLFIRPGSRMVRVQTPPAGWTVESWVARYNASRGYTIPNDPKDIRAPLPTVEAAGGESTQEVVVDIDLL